MRKTSPKVKINFGTLGAGETIIYDSYNRSPREFPAGKYAPFNTLIVQNNSSVVVNIVLDDKFNFDVRSNSAFIIEREDGIEFSRIKITNKDTTNSVSDNQLYIYVQYIKPPLTERI